MKIVDNEYGKFRTNVPLYRETTQFYQFLTLKDDVNTHLVK